MFIWMFAAILMLYVEAFFKDHPHYEYITLGFAFVYTFCIIMFMRSFRKSTEATMRTVENSSMDFISTTIRTGQGKVKYMTPTIPDGAFKNFYADLFNITYLRVYETEFMDSGMEFMKSHKVIPVGKKKLFQIKLMGGYDTTSREHAVKALEFLGEEWPLP